MNKRIHYRKRRVMRRPKRMSFFDKLLVKGIELFEKYSRTDNFNLKLIKLKASGHKPVSQVIEVDFNSKVIKKKITNNNIENSVLVEMEVA